MKEDNQNSSIELILNIFGIVASSNEGYELIKPFFTVHHSETNNDLNNLNKL